MDKTELARIGLRQELTECIKYGGDAEAVADAVLELIDARIREVLATVRAVPDAGDEHAT
jgi:hypothetical protein